MSRYSAFMFYVQKDKLQNALFFLKKEKGKKKKLSNFSTQPLDEESLEEEEEEICIYIKLGTDWSEAGRPSCRREVQ